MLTPMKEWIKFTLEHMYRQAAHELRRQLLIAANSREAGESYRSWQRLHQQAQVLAARSRAGPKVEEAFKLYAEYTHGPLPHLIMVGLTVAVTL